MYRFTIYTSLLATTGAPIAGTFARREREVDRVEDVIAELAGDFPGRQDRVIVSINTLGQTIVTAQPLSDLMTQQGIEKADEAHCGAVDDEIARQWMCAEGIVGYREGEPGAPHYVEALKAARRC